MKTQTVLIVEDEGRLATIISRYLLQAGYETVIIHDGAEVISWFKSHLCDLVLLDIMLPNKDGITICKELRQVSDIPIIMCTAKVEEIDRLLGLELGADDYICKPFSPREVLARVKAVLRRSTHASENSSMAPVELDEDKLVALANGIKLDLSAIEFRLLNIMVKSTGCVFSRKNLIDRAYDDNRVISDRSIDSHIKRLRLKLKNASNGSDYIHSVYGVGYKFDIPV